MFCGKCGHKFSKTGIAYCTQCGTSRKTTGGVSDNRNTAIEEFGMGNMPKPRNKRLFFGGIVASVAVLVFLIVALIVFAESDEDEDILTDSNMYRVEESVPANNAPLKDNDFDSEYEQRNLVEDWLRNARDEVPEVRLDPTGPDDQRITLNPASESDNSQDSQNTDRLFIDESMRNTSKFTFLVLGLDQGGTNTDAMMVGTFDVDTMTFNIVNIPRDTLVNVNWNLRAANSIYANMLLRYRGEENAEQKAMEATVEAFSDILGFMVDYWLVVDFRGMTSLVDAIGGVDFNVPINTYHSGVTLQRGQRHLNGAQALHMLRYRGFASGDIGRINTMQNFLTAAAEQIISRKDSIQVADLANVFLHNVMTDIPLSNLVWFGERFLELDPENIRFHTMPGQIDNIHGGSFVSILLDEWLELLNNYISPWNFEITPESVSILTRGHDRRLFVTDGNWLGNPEWGAGTLGASEPNNIAEWHTPRGGETSNRPAQPSQQERCSYCNNPLDFCTLCFVCGSHDCTCEG